MRFASPTARFGAAPSRFRRSGVALVIVMLVVFAMTVAAGLFAYSMKVEIRLAQNSNSGPELAWLGLSGVEYAKWWIAQEAAIPGEGAYQGLNQRWAGGPGSPDFAESPLAGLSLKDVAVGEGRVSIRIVDLERRFNINNADLGMLRSALSEIGADSTDAEIVANAIIDWRDRDGLSQPGRPAETEDYYSHLDPPYRAKDGPIDDMSEVLKIRGVTPEIFYGIDRGRDGGVGAAVAPAKPAPGLVDLFCTLSSGQVNINTAPLPVLQLALGGDSGSVAAAEGIIKERAGPDGIDGTEDDQPARNPGEIGRLMGGQAVTGRGPATAAFTVFSNTYEIHLEAIFGVARQRFVAVIQRRNPRDFATVLFRAE